MLAALPGIRIGLSTIAAAMLLAGCATASTHPSLQSARLPELMSVRRVVADIDYRGEFAISPDGQRLLWVRRVGLDVGLAVRKIDRPGQIPSTPDAQFATGHLARPLAGTGNFGWFADSRHAYYYKDLTGAENTQIVIVDTRAPDAEPWRVTPWPGVRSFLLDDGTPTSTRVLFASNRRDRSTFDVYEADFASRQTREIARSDGNVLHWIVDTDGRLGGRIRQLGPNDGDDRVVELAERIGDPPEAWRVLRQTGGFDWWRPLRLDSNDQRLYAASNVGRDKEAVIEIDLETGAERILYQHARVDLGPVSFPRLRGAPYAVTTTPDYSTIDYLGTPMGRDMKAAVERALALARQQSAILGEIVFARPASVSADARRLVVKVFSFTGVSELLFDRTTDAVSLLHAPPPDAERLLVPVKPFLFTASDGMAIAGYVIRPKGVTAPAPLVVSIHGGPWWRDFWSASEFDPTQLLANRGYAVIKVNYRGSAGYGREFMAAGARVTATRLQQDIAEAVQWAIDQGIADPSRMAVLGGSFGGFSTLMQLIDKPHPYACGVDIVGVANWPRLVENWPPFWRNRHYWEWFFGNIHDPTEREQMWRGSPLSRIDRITAPLLVIHGANDIRVAKQDSDDVVAELRKLGRPVEYLVFDNEGHQVRRWRNRLAMWRAIEDFLAGCLGGRSGGFDYYQLMPR